MREFSPQAPVEECAKCGDVGIRNSCEFVRGGFASPDLLAYPCNRCGHHIVTLCKDARPAE